MVISDPKGELFQYTNKYLKSLGYEVICLDYKNRSVGAMNFLIENSGGSSIWAWEKTRLDYRHGRDNSVNGVYADGHAKELTGIRDWDSDKIQSFGRLGQNELPTVTGTL